MSGGKWVVQEGCRNPSLFNWLCRVANKQVLDLRLDRDYVLQPWTERKKEALRKRLETIALRTNSHFDPPMAEGEVFGIVRSVCKYAYEWEGFHRQIKARKNGRKGGLETQRKRREKAEERRDMVEVLRMAKVPRKRIARIHGVSLRTIIVDIRAIRTGIPRFTPWKNSTQCTGSQGSLSKVGNTVRFSSTSPTFSTQGLERERNLDDFPAYSPVWRDTPPSDDPGFRDWILYRLKEPL